MHHRERPGQSLDRLSACDRRAAVNRGVGGQAKYSVLQQHRYVRTRFTRQLLHAEATKQVIDIGRSEQRGCPAFAVD